MTRWAFAVADVTGGSGDTSVLAITETAAAALPVLATDQLADAATGGARAVLRRQVLVALANRALSVPPGTVRLTRTGVRALVGCPVFASVAWRPGWVVAALAVAPLGIDVERIDEVAAAPDLALDGFDGDPAAWHGPAGVWAAKEAALKALGRDLTSGAVRWRFGTGTIGVDDALPMPVELRRVPDAVVAVVTRP